jgi:6-phosphofructokinase
MRFGILTSGGDCPGLNAAIRAFVRRALLNGDEVWGFKDGWKGVVFRNYEVLNREKISGIIYQGGTILGTSRFNPLQDENFIRSALSNLQEIDGLVVIGGNGSLHIAYQFQRMWGKVIFIPKTIDNDVWGTESIGFDTAVNIAMGLIDRLHSTAESHKRVFVVQVMGRHTGWIALYSGISAGADVVVIPEYPLTVEEIVEIVENRRKMGKSFSIVVVAEGVRYSDQKVQNVGIHIQRKLAEILKIETRFVEIGYVLRGGSPTAYDRLMAHTMGNFAYDLASNGKFGMITAYNGYDVFAMDIRSAVGRLKTVGLEEFLRAKAFFG